MNAAHRGWDEQCRSLLQAPPWLERPFIVNGLAHADVHRMAARLYWQLQDIAAKAPICLASEDKALCAAALLAALAGGPSLLLPYALSPQALAALHSATGYRYALCSAGLELPSGVAALRLPEENPSRSAQPLPHNPSQDTILHLFTGGSTGAPQMWSKTAANLFGEAFFIAAHHGIEAQDRIGATTAPYHIYGLLYSVLLPLVSGATVLQETSAFPEEMVGAVRAHDISIFISVPAHYRALNGKRCSSNALRLAFSSAGMLDAADNQAFYHTNNTGIVEVYGSTETGGIACRNRYQGEEHFTVLPPIHWQLSPEERLMVRSPFLSPELPLDTAGFFHTADRIAPLGPNSFSLLGRADLVVKVGGKRVDLDALRKLLQEQPGVQEAMVLALPETGSRENRIAVILTAQAGKTLDGDSLRRKLAQQFEPYALPRIIKIVEQIPVKANGKYDREAILALVTA